jgi:autotransporter-associated beta strand protein
VTIASGAILNLSTNSQAIGSLTGAGNVTRTTAALTTGGNNTSTTYSGIINGSGAVTKVGSGTWTLSGANTYTGDTNINAGTLLAGAANTLSSGSAVTVASGAVLDLNNNSQVIGSLAGAGNVAFGSGSPLGTLTTGGSNASTTFSGLLTGTGILTKTGSGTMILTGNNTFDGQTNVNGGTLLVNGQSGSNSGTGSGSVFVGNGGTFGGTGRSNGVAFQVATGGTLRGGDQNLVGSLELSGNVDLADGATLGIRITDGTTPSSTPGGSTIGGTPNPSSNNFIHVTNGGLTANPGGILLTVDGTGVTFARQAYSYQIATVDGQDLSGLNITNQSQFSTTGFTSPYQFTLTGDINGAIFLNINPVPEPAMMLGLAAGALGFGGLIRRRLWRSPRV